MQVQETGKYKNITPNNNEAGYLMKSDIVVKIVFAWFNIHAISSYLFTLYLKYKCLSYLYVGIAVKIILVMVSHNVSCACVRVRERESSLINS